jgi:hypothetical protein
MSSPKKSANPANLQIEQIGKSSETPMRMARACPISGSASGGGRKRQQINQMDQ